MSRGAFLCVLGAFLAMAVVAPLATAQSAGSVGIVHTPPASPLPRLQIDLTAILKNATSAVVLWNNGSMSKAATVPMTNLSRRQDGGWVYEAWLPAQPDGTEVSYTITATGPAGTKSLNFTLSVSLPSPQGLTQADQDTWILTMAASLSMAASTVAAVYYYISLRLRREAT